MKYAKGILSLIFSLTPSAVVGVLTLFHIHLDLATVTTLIGVVSPILGTLGVVVGPANKTPENGSQPPEGASEPQSIEDLLKTWFD